MPFFKRSSRKVPECENGSVKIPRHLAIIMDGNRRWAKMRGLPGSAGYSAGAETFRNIAYYCRDLGLEYLTVYAFSTENWKRPADEVSVIMGILEKYLREAIEKMAAEGIRFKVLGNTDALPAAIQRLVDRAVEISAAIQGFQANLCINYGGRDEILRAASSYASDLKSGNSFELTEDVFSSYLDTGGMPDPELVIRPSGEIRISNFLLWQSAYSEFYFTDKLWPDFDKAEIDRALAEFSRRSRRFGA